HHVCMALRSVPLPLRHPGVPPRPSARPGPSGADRPVAESMLSPGSPDAKAPAATRAPSLALAVATQFLPCSFASYSARSAAAITAPGEPYVGNAATPKLAVTATR